MRFFSFWLGAYTLPVEMGKMVRMAQVASLCPLCPGMHVGDEWHYGLECPAFDDTRCGIFLMIVTGPCDSSCGTHASRRLHRALQKANAAP